MLPHQPGQDGERFVPAPLRLVRIDRAGRHHLAGGIDHRDLHARAEAGIEPERGPRARRRGEQQIAQVGGEDPHRFFLGRRPQAQAQVDRQHDRDLGAPGPAHRIGQPLVARPPLVGDAIGPHDAQLVGAGDGLGGGRPRRGIVRLDIEAEDLLALAAAQGQHAVRGHLGQGLREFEIVAELGAGFLLALPHLRNEAAVGPEFLAQGADQVGILGEALDQDGARALQRRRRVGDVLVGRDEGRRALGGQDRGIAEEQVRERPQPCLLGDLGLGAALGLVGEVDVLQAALAVGRQDRRLELGVELSLVAHGLEDDLPPGFELAQVAQPLLQRAELRIVQRSGDFLAVSRDEGDGRAAVEQLDRGLDLLFLDAEFLGNARLDGDHQENPLRPELSDTVALVGPRV